MKLETAQELINNLLELTCYRAYTIAQANQFIIDNGDLEDDLWDESGTELILCVKYDIEEESLPGHLHPGFIIKICEDEETFEAMSIIPPGPVYKDPSLDVIIENIMDYYNELED